ncbi:hypothetical protein IFR05_006002 [Cadophora sp. M221]|nr:hypothetical protein IFR05_006002 [Cadophora sp. M221]
MGFKKFAASYRKVFSDNGQNVSDEAKDGDSIDGHETGVNLVLRVHSIQYLLLIFVSISALLLAFGLGYGLRHSPPHLIEAEKNLSDSSPCGNLSTEAQSLGCSFDQLMWAWYPPQCPHYANDEFVKAEPDAPWRYYDDLYHGKAIFAESDGWAQVLDSGVQLWGERREHLTHCVYMFLSAGQII